MIRGDKIQRINGRNAALNDIKNLGVDFALDHYETLMKSGYSEGYIEGYIEAISEMLEEV